MRGSVTTSNRRAISISAAASAKVSPNTFVKNKGKAMDIIFHVMPPAAASPRAYAIFSLTVTAEFFIRVRLVRLISIIRLQ
jgi:hypothetical protein